MDESTVARYLARIGQVRPERPTPQALRLLQEAHLKTVPFENLSIHLHEPIVLEEAPLVEKIVERHRGGFCYELNGAFAGLLRALGFEVTMLAARVFSGDRLNPLFDHLALRVDAEEPWLADVGFGDFSLFPLALEHDGSQTDPLGSFDVLRTPEGDVDVVKDGVMQYRVELRARDLPDFEPMCWWHQTSPRSHFTRSLVCSMALPDGRATLSDRRLIRTVNGERTEAVLIDDAEVLATYRGQFGIDLDRPPSPLTFVE